MRNLTWKDNEEEKLSINGIAQFTWLIKNIITVYNRLVSIYEECPSI